MCTCILSSNYTTVNIPNKSLHFPANIQKHLPHTRLYYLIVLISLSHFTSNFKDLPLWSNSHVFLYIYTFPAGFHLERKWNICWKTTAESDIKAIAVTQTHIFFPLQNELCQILSKGGNATFSSGTEKVNTLKREVTQKLDKCCQ